MSVSALRVFVFALVMIAFGGKACFAQNQMTYKQCGGQIYDLRGDKPVLVTFEQFKGEILDAKGMLMGERHGVAAHPQTTACLFPHLKEKKISIVMEQLSLDQMDIVQKHREEFPESASSLGAKLNWSKTGWARYSNYLPLINAAWLSRSKLVAGDLASGSDKLMPALMPHDQDAKAHKAWQDALFVSSCEMGQSDDLKNQATYQMVRDEHMASQILAEIKENNYPLFFGGRSHLRKDRAIPRVLSKVLSGGLTASSNVMPNPKILSVALFETKTLEGETNQRDVIANSKNIYDFLWFVGEVNSEDTCLKLKKLGLINSDKPIKQ